MLCTITFTSDNRVIARDTIIVPDDLMQPTTNDKQQDHWVDRVREVAGSLLTVASRKIKEANEG